MGIHRLCACALAALLLLAGTLQAETLTLTAVDLGWYQQVDPETCLHDPSIQNYLVGRYTTSVTADYRDFFVFDLGTVANQIVSAKLVVHSLDVQALNQSETYQLCDVTTPVATLIAGDSNQTAVFADLGTGVTYGARDFVTSDANSVVEIPLNADFVAAANVARGSQIALGGAITTLIANSTDDQYLFCFAGDTPLDNSQLVVETVPEPSVLLLSATGCVGLLAFVWRKRR